MMMKQPTELVVLIGGARAGCMRRGKGRRLSFKYDGDYAADSSSTQLSLSLPLGDDAYRHAAVDRWVTSLLPDDPAEVARQYSRHSVTDPFGLLATRVGHDCAGAVQFCPPERLDELLDRSSGIVALTPQEVAREIRMRVEDDPGKWDYDTIEPCYSLSGYQKKIALHHTPSGWARPFGATPTTHILKPRHRDNGESAVVEHLCAEAALSLGLDAITTEIELHAGHPVVVIRRYDRADEGGHWVRRHQEDMCQALGRDGGRRHEHLGGPGMSAIADLLEVHSIDPDTDRRKFADGLLWALITANRDAHARNYSMLIKGRKGHLAPLYDLQSSLPHVPPNRLGDLVMAMRYGSTFTIYNASSNHSLRDTAARLKLPSHWVIDRAEELATVAHDAFLPAIDRLSPKVRDFINADEFLQRLDKRVKVVVGTAARNRAQLSSRRRPEGSTGSSGSRAPGPDAERDGVAGLSADAISAAKADAAARTDAESTKNQEHCGASTLSDSNCSHPRPAPGGHCPAGHERPR